MNFDDYPLYSTLSGRSLPIFFMATHRLPEPKPQKANSAESITAEYQIIYFFVKGICYCSAILKSSLQLADSADTGQFSFVSVIRSDCSAKPGSNSTELDLDDPADDEEAKIFDAISDLLEVAQARFENRRLRPGEIIMYANGPGQFRTVKNFAELG